MKVKALMIISLFCICNISFGQEFKNDLTSVKTIDNQIQEEQYSTDEIPLVDRLLLRTPIDNISYRDKQFYSKKEWRKIKKQILKNKKKITNQKNSIHVSKVIDTIYLDIPSFNKVSRLSGW